MKNAYADASQENVMLVDGYLIRNTLDTDFNILHRHGMDVDSFAPKFYIPPGEVWVDYPYADEVEFLLAADRLVDAIKAESREVLLTTLKNIGFFPKGPPPPFVIKEELRGPLTICVVNGAIVREWMDPEFVLGGHDIVYPSYIPKNEVWIDGKMDPRESHLVLAHELDERSRMERDGLPYEIAHEYATVMERVLRRKEGAAFPGEWGYPFYDLPSQDITKRFYVAKQPRKKRPVVVEHCVQSKGGMCGPASLKMALSAWGRNVTEEELTLLADASMEYGTEHEGLVKAARHLGAIVTEKDGGTLAEIEQLVKEKHLPVIVGWFDKDGDHYGVVTDVTPEYLVIADPDWDMPERFVQKEHFEKVWFDFVGHGNATTSWKWYMAISYPPSPAATGEGPGERVL